jgi:hypothetical protein
MELSPRIAYNPLRQAVRNHSAIFHRSVRGVMMRYLRIFALASVLVTVVIPAGKAQEPSFVYETIIPGYYLSFGHDIAVDATGNAYVAASWYEDHLHLDILVVKLDPDGTPLWTRTLAGNGHDYAEDIALDDGGYVYIAGWTDSDDFPIVNALDSTLTGFRDAFLMKMSAIDGTILYSTFLGGDYVDAARGITLSDAGEIYLVGSTGSADFPTVNAYQDSPSAPAYTYSDAFITRLSPSGDSILYSTYFGGYKDDNAISVALDSQQDIIFSGETNAEDFPIVDPILADPNDLFVSKLSADGSTLLFSTYFGGEDLDRLAEMVLDAGDLVHLTGLTRSIFFPVTPGALQETFAGEILGCGSPPFDPLHNCEDVFVTKLATDGTGLVYSTYLGGTKVDEGHSVAIDALGRAHVVGYTISPDFPGSDSTYAGFFLSRLTPTGTDLDYTLRKQSGSGGGNGTVIDGANDVYFTGAVNVPADVYIAKVTGGGTSVESRESVYSDARLWLGPCTPNPTNSTASFAYSVPVRSAAPVSLTVRDVLGRRVRTLASRAQTPGYHVVRWDGVDDSGQPVASGVYFSRLEWKGQCQTREIVVIR